MGLVRDVSPFHLRDLNFLGTVWLVVLFVVFCLVWVLCLLFGCLFGLLPPRMRSFTLLNCVRIVCNLERPSELSWRARHGRKKKAAILVVGLLVFEPNLMILTKENVAASHPR